MLSTNRDIVKELTGNFLSYVLSIKDARSARWQSSLSLASHLWLSTYAAESRHLLPQSFLFTSSHLELCEVCRVQASCYHLVIIPVVSPSRAVAVVHMFLDVWPRDWHLLFWGAFSEDGLRQAALLRPPVLSFTCAALSLFFFSVFTSDWRLYCKVLFQGYIVKCSSVFKITDFLFVLLARA